MGSSHTLENGPSSKNKKLQPSNHSTDRPMASANLCGRFGSFNLDTQMDNHPWRVQHFVRAVTECGHREIADSVQFATPCLKSVISWLAPQ